VENSTNHFDIIVVGNGIAAHCLLWDIAKLNKSLRILRIYDDQAFPSCTTRTTSVVSMDVHKKGMSHLGDILVNSHEAFKRFVDTYKPSGVYEAKQFYVFDETMDEQRKSQYLSRYGNVIVDVFGAKGVYKNSYVIKPELLIQFMEEAISASRLEITHKIARVDKIENKTVFSEAKSFSFKNLILATSAYTNLFYSNHALPQGKPVSGSYYIWNNIDLDKYFNQSTVLSKGHFNIIYRSDSKELLFGGTSKEGLIFENHVMELESEYTKLKAFFLGIDLPSIGEAQSFTGIRHKGKKRIPFADKVEDNIYVMNALYKNGFSFPFFGSSKIVQELSKDI